MKSILSILIVLASIASSIAQSSYNKDSYKILNRMDFFTTYKAGRGDLKTVLEENDIKGTPYLSSEFVTGSIYTKTKQKYIDIPLRYNAYNDEMEFKSADGKIQALGTPDIIEAVEYDDNIMVYIPYTNNKKIKNGFFKVLVGGEVSLFSKPEIIFKQAGEPNAYDNAKPAEFVRRPDTYYIKVGTEQAKKVGSKKDLLEILPEYKKEVSTFIKKNKVKPSEADKLIELIKYYNSLL